jgi:uncharacterized integral membrane protein
MFAALPDLVLAALAVLVVGAAMAAGVGTQAMMRKRRRAMQTGTTSTNCTPR